MGSFSRGRFWEIDLVRGIAIILMVVFHLVYDLNYFGNQSFDPGSGIWLYAGRIAAILFIFLVGLSLTISFSRTRSASPGKVHYMKYLKRGMRIFSLGMLITLVTLLFLPDGAIFFGILHFIGISIILAYPFLSNRLGNLFYGLVFILIGLYLKDLSFGFSWLLWLGLRPESFYTFDYFPIFPWFGVTLFGIFAGNLLYPGNKRSFNIPDLSKYAPARLLCIMGQRSLLIYLVHQPILILLLHILGVIDVVSLTGNL